MNSAYDMCVSYDTLCDLEDKFRKIDDGLRNSTEQMIKAIQNSQEFLSGNQFERAKSTTSNCVELTEKTSNNINRALKYIDELMSALEEYGSCGY